MEEKMEAPLIDTEAKIVLKNSKKWLQVSFWTGSTLIALGCIGWILLPLVIRVFAHKNLVLQEGKEAFEKWKKTPIPVNFKVYLFNVTNPHELMNGAKPIVKQVGPFVYKQYRSKKVMGWDPDLKTVTYLDQKMYFFEPNVSDDDSQKIYSLNLPLQGIVMFLKKLPDFSRSLVVPLLEGILQNYNESLFSYRSPRELLFEGYKVNLIQDLIDIASTFVTVPELLPNNTFGFLYDKNNSGDGIFEVFTGEDDIKKYSQIVKWNNESRIPYWNDRFCNMMNGTDGAQFPPPVTKTDVLYAYSPDLCRSIFLEFEEDVRVHGIPALRFGTPERLFASPQKNPDNMCFCTEPEYCHLSGILDVSPCKKGVKLALTGPHFLKGHPFVQDQVIGLDPVKELHDSYVDVEPNTGFVLRASRKLQANFILEPFSEMEELKKIQSTIVPLMWVVEEAEINDEVAALFTAKVRTPLTIAKSVLTACIVLGILWIITAGFVTVYILVKEQKTAKAVIKSKYKSVPQKAEDIIKSEKVSNVNV